MSKAFQRPGDPKKVEPKRFTESTVSADELTTNRHSHIWAGGQWKAIARIVSSNDGQTVFGYAPPEDPDPFVLFPTTSVNVRLK